MKKTSRYVLHYLTCDERELAGLRPCHLCCFGGLRLECQTLCKVLGQDAYFCETSVTGRNMVNQRKRAAWQKAGIAHVIIQE